jgi:hypothetical protein
MNLPESCEKHQPDYKANIWKQYSIDELGMWVHLFVKRAFHRDNKEKAKKDLYDAQNYLNMIQSYIDNAKYNLEEN